MVKSLNGERIATFRPNPREGREDLLSMLFGPVPLLLVFLAWLMRGRAAPIAVGLACGIAEAAFINWASGVWTFALWMGFLIFLAAASAARGGHRSARYVPAPPGGT